MPEPVNPYLAPAKLALRLTVDDYDAEIIDLIEAALADLNVVGVGGVHFASSALVKRAVITYCRANFGSPDDYEELKKSYDEQKGQLITAFYDPTRTGGW